MYAPRRAFGEALVELGRVNDRILVLDADVGTSTQASLFRTAFPDRFYEIGIAEQNMMGIAAGLATFGWIPFVSTFAVFASRRACDQVSISIAFPRLNVKINGGYGGIPTGKAGATHQAFEDLAIMRAIPNMTVVATADAVETRKAVFAAADFDGPLYLRTVRCEVPTIFDETHDFRIGRSYPLRPGNDVAILSTEMMTAKALAASDELGRLGVRARVLHVPTIKPIDEDAILAAASETRGIVTVENHSIIGGLGGAVAEVLAERHPAPLRRIGVRDHFGESGDIEAVLTKFAMNTEHIVAAAKSLLD
ncbi:MAG: transketolase family protein [Planctomycetota bacterium]